MKHVNIGQRMIGSMSSTRLLELGTERKLVTIEKSPDGKVVVDWSFIEETFGVRITDKIQDAETREVKLQINGGEYLPFNLYFTNDDGSSNGV